MKFLLDANMPRLSMTAIEDHGHIAEHANDVGLGSAEDAALSARAHATEAILVTRGLAFADVRRYPPRARPGSS